MSENCQAVQIKQMTEISQTNDAKQNQSNNQAQMLLNVDKRDTVIWRTRLYNKTLAV